MTARLPLPPLVEPDLHADAPWPVAVALGGLGLRCFSLWGVRQRFTPAATELVCECAPGAGRDCKKGQTGKHPRGVGWQDRASADALVLSLYAKRWPRGNCGVVTGERVVVVDVDGEQGLQSLATLQSELGPLPETVRSRSGRTGPGFHLWFALRPEEPIPRNSASTLGTGIDVRGTGGFVVAPGSLHKTGNRYRWEIAPDEIGFAYLPQTWLAAMTAGGGTRKAGSTGQPGARIFRRPACGSPPRNPGSWLIGDAPGHGGFNAPIYKRMCAYFAAQADAPAEPIIGAIRAAILSAPKAPGRDITRYMDGRYLAEQAEKARDFVRSRHG